MSAGARRLGLGLRRIRALSWKESLQIIRDPSVILIAFVLPMVMLFLFAYAVSLDIKQVRIGVVVEADSAAAQSLAAAFAATRYFVVTPARDRREVVGELQGGRLRGFIAIPQDFQQRLASRSGQPLVQVVTDGSQPNTANFVGTYAQGVIAGWQASRPSPRAVPVSLEPRFWFNPEIESRRFLVPGAIAVVMTIIGTLLTALVVAREWERGTMEAILSTPASVNEIIIGKLLPYFALGLGATFCATVLAITVFGVPFRGSWLTLIALSCAFLFPALGQGLLISTVARNQFIAAQMALFSGFLPAFLLSGFLFEIDSMPAPIRALTYVVPARYFVSSLQTVFLAGDVWALLLPNTAALVAIGLVLFALVRAKTRKTLDV
ncbi:MAG: ABC transporter permease [Gammaproteobacteria bacterium]|nr:ABC transporter permease [Gammaproteobacteria bacterium]